jgi:hypothetical protein
MLSSTFIPDLCCGLQEGTYPGQAWEIGFLIYARFLPVFNDLAGCPNFSLCICTSQATPRRKTSEPVIASTTKQSFIKDKTTITT